MKKITKIADLLISVFMISGSVYAASLNQYDKATYLLIIGLWCYNDFRKEPCKINQTHISK